MCDGYEKSEVWLGMGIHACGNRVKWVGNE